MGLYLRDGRPVGICQRCQRKFYLDELGPDPDIPGILVCADDTDLRDPYKIPARKTESIALQGTSPDTPLT